MKAFSEIEIGGTFYIWDERQGMCKFDKISPTEAVNEYGIVTEFHPDYNVFPA